MDSVLFWNGVALEANRVSHSNGRGESTGPTLSSRALGIVHLAIHDAVFGIRKKKKSEYSTYLTDLPAAKPGASVDAAVASAAHATLSSLFPSQKPFFDQQHLNAEIQGSGIADGHAFGLLVASKILKLRESDPNSSDNGYAGSIAKGAHRPDPDNPTQGFNAPFYGARSKCFSVTKRHELDAPPQPGTPEYLQALRQVRSAGIAPNLVGTLPKDSVPRTPEQTLIGLYWGYDGANGLGTPPRLYNQIVREVAMKQENSLEDNARLFALVNVAMADAGILAWDQKYLHDLWRPVVGIREHDGSMGPTGGKSGSFSEDCDPGWLPLGAPNTNSTNKNFTPSFPAYPSGHATFGAAALQMTRLFYKVKENATSDDLFKDMTFVSEELNGRNTDNLGAIRPRHAREFKRGLWEMIVENGISRVYLGVHWVFDAFQPDKNGEPDLKKCIGGVPLGLAIANDIFTSGMMMSDVGPRTSDPLSA